MSSAVLSKSAKLISSEGSALLKATLVIRFKLKDGEGGANSFISISYKQPNSHEGRSLQFVLS